MYSALLDTKSAACSRAGTFSQSVCMMPFAMRPEKSTGLGPSDNGSHKNSSELYESPSQVTSKVSRMVGCHKIRDTLLWNSKTARSSAAVTSQIQTVLGASSSLVARSTEDGSNDMEAQPDDDATTLLDWPFGG